MASLRADVKKQLDAADTGKTGKLPRAAYDAILKGLVTMNEAEQSALSKKLDSVESGGDIKINDFLDIFCGPNVALSRELSKPISAEETEAMKKVFAQFDKSGDGKICVKELKAMCAELGKNMTDSQAQAAMRQLDRNGDDTVDFEEFSLWWSCTPGLGGYSHVALSFLKAKLQFKNKTKQLFSKVQRNKVENPNECVIKGYYDLSPNFLNGKAGSEEKSSVFMKLVKAGEPKSEPTICIKVAFKDPDSAASVLKDYEDLLATVVGMMGPPPIPIKATQDKQVIAFEIGIPPDAFDSDLKEMLPLWESAMKKVEVKITMGNSFEDMVAHPLLPIPLQFKGAKVVSDSLICLESFVATAKDMPPPAAAFVKCLAGYLTEATFGYDETTPLVLASRFKEMNSGPTYDPVSKLTMSCVDKSLEHMQKKLYELACVDGIEGFGMIKDGKWDMGGMPDDLKLKSTGLMQSVCKLGAGFESIVVSGVPDSPLELHFKFDKVNPFCLANYLIASWPAPPPGSVSMEKPLESEEEARLREVFAKYDKDKSGAIDIKELQTMISELGGTATEEEIKAAMVELDTNKDGTCCFPEFKKFWCSSSNLGGHNSMMLNFLKFKMKATSMMSKGRSALSKAGAASKTGADDGTHDTVISITQEASPALAEVKDEKMLYSMELDIEDKAAPGTPQFNLVLYFSSDDAAKKAAGNLESFLSDDCPMAPGMKMKDFFEMQGFQPKVTQADKKVCTTITVPKAMLEEMVYSQEDLMSAVVPLIKALRNSGIKVSMMNTFGDFLSSPDTPFYETLSGSKVQTNLSATAIGKKMFFKLLKSKAPSEKEAASVIDTMKLLTGAEINQSLGWHKAAIKDAVGQMLPEGIELSPAGMKNLVQAMAPGDCPDEMKGMIKNLVAVIQSAEGVESFSLENIELPKRFSQSGTDAVAAVRSSFENFKPFPLVQYIFGPVFESWGVAA